MQRGNVYLTPAEEEIVEAFRQTYGLSELQAVEQAVRQKRHTAYDWARRGQVELAEQMFKELGEWEQVKDQMPKKIILADAKGNIVDVDGNPFDDFE